MDGDKGLVVESGGVEAELVGAGCREAGGLNVRPPLFPPFRIHVSPLVVHFGLGRHGGEEPQQRVRDKSIPGCCC